MRQVEIHLNTPNYGHLTWLDISREIELCFFVLFSKNGRILQPLQFSVYFITAMLTTAAHEKDSDADYFWNVGGSYTNRPNRNQLNSPFPLLRFRSTLHCGYSGITDKDSGLECKY